MVPDHQDHSFVQNLVDEGRITVEEGADPSAALLVTKVLTGQPDDDPDVVVRQAIPGDRYLIASDGLTDYVARDTIDEVLLGERKPVDACERLVALALRAGAPDNVTVVMATSSICGSAPSPPGCPDRRGAAATRKGTRPIPVTPAEKAAASPRRPPARMRAAGRRARRGGPTDPPRPLCASSGPSRSP